MITRCFLIERDWKVVVDQTTLSKFYHRHGIKNYSLSYTYQQSLKDYDER